MKIVIVRHGDPDYSIDSLTEKGWREAACLAERLKQMDVKAFYCSPMRMSNFGDTSHLYIKGEPEAFSARFCECYANEEERHD